MTVDNLVACLELYDGMLHVYVGGNDKVPKDVTDVSSEFLDDGSEGVFIETVPPQKVTQSEESAEDVTEDDVIDEDGNGDPEDEADSLEHRRTDS